MAEKKVSILTSTRDLAFRPCPSDPPEHRITFTAWGIALCLFLAVSSPSLWGRDFPEPLPAFDALWGVGPESPSLLPASYLRLRYDNFALQSSPTDDFQIQGLGSFTLFQYRGIAALKLSYGTYLLVGPLAPGDTAASAAEWWMNSVQFQYGLYGAFNVGGAHLLLEYSRLSNHPLRAKRTETESFENPASERIATGIVLPPLGFENLKTQAYFRTGFVDLFDYWEAKHIPKPRTFWLHRFGLDSTLRVHPSLCLYLDASVDLLALRAGGWDASWIANIGLLFPSGNREIKLFLTVVWNNDTEEIVEKPNPIRLVGLGFSLSAGP